MAWIVTMPRLMAPAAPGVAATTCQRGKRRAPPEVCVRGGAGIRLERGAWDASRRQAPKRAAAALLAAIGAQRADSPAKQRARPGRGGQAKLLGRTALDEKVVGAVHAVEGRRARRAPRSMQQRGGGAARGRERTAWRAPARVAWRRPGAQRAAAWRETSVQARRHAWCRSRHEGAARLVDRVTRRVVDVELPRGDVARDERRAREGPRA